MPIDVFVLLLDMDANVYKKLKTEENLKGKNTKIESTLTISTLGADNKIAL